MRKYVPASGSSFFKNSRKVCYLQDAGLEEVHSKPLVFDILIISILCDIFHFHLQYRVS